MFRCARFLAGAGLWYVSMGSSCSLVLLFSKSSHMIQMLLSVEMWCDLLKEQRTLSVFSRLLRQQQKKSVCMCKGQCLMTALIKASLYSTRNHTLTRLHVCRQSVCVITQVRSSKSAAALDGMHSIKQQMDSHFCDVWFSWMAHMCCIEPGEHVWRAAFVLFKHNAQFRRLWFLLNQCVVISVARLDGRFPAQKLTKTRPKLSK